MSSQRPPTSAQASWEYDDNAWQHPTDDLLLAYVRRQHLDNLIEIEQHIALCPFCREQCRAFGQSSELLAGWAQDKEQQIHPSVANLVIQRIALEGCLSPAERVAAHLRQAYKYSLLQAIVQRIMGNEGADGKRQAAPIDVSPLSPLSDEPLPGPFAELQTSSFPRLRSGMAASSRSRSLKRPVITLVVAVAIFTLFIGLIVSPRILPGNAAGSRSPKVIDVPDQHSTPTTQKTSLTPTRSTPAPSGPRLTFCPGKHYSLHLCGYGFTSGGRVWLSVYGPFGNTAVARPADTHGEIDIPFNLTSCKPISLLIIAVDDSSHKIATLSTSAFTNCPASKHR